MPLVPGRREPHRPLSKTRLALSIVGELALAGIFRVEAEDHSSVSLVPGEIFGLPNPSTVGGATDPVSDLAESRWVRTRFDFTGTASGAGLYVTFRNGGYFGCLPSKSSSIVIIWNRSYWSSSERRYSGRSLSESTPDKESSLPGDCQ